MLVCKLSVFAKVQTTTVVRYLTEDEDGGNGFLMEEETEYIVTE